MKRTDGHHGPELSELLGYNLRRASAAMMSHFNRAFGDVPLTAQQFAILLSVERRPGISQRELCGELAIKKANMAPLIAELENRVLLARAASASDRRVQALSLTDRARKELPGWKCRVAEHEAQFFAPLPDSDRQQLRRMLRSLWLADEVVPPKPAEPD